MPGSMTMPLWMLHNIVFNLCPPLIRFTAVEIRLWINVGPKPAFLDASSRCLFRPLSNCQIYDQSVFEVRQYVIHRAITCISIAYLRYTLCNTELEPLSGLYSFLILTITTDNDADLASSAAVNHPVVYVLRPGYDSI